MLSMQSSERDMLLQTALLVLNAWVTPPPQESMATYFLKYFLNIPDVATSHVSNQKVETLEPTGHAMCKQKGISKDTKKDSIRSVDQGIQSQPL